jgi:hypothetical protein
MSKFPERLKLKERAEENCYFAKRDRELIKAMRDKKLAKTLELSNKGQKKAARLLEQEYEDVSKSYRKMIKKLIGRTEKI